MKTQYQSLTDFAQEIERRERVKNDFLAPSSKLLMVQDQNLAIEGAGEFSLTDYAHDQIAGHYHIPRKYYDAMAEVPGLRSLNVNAWMRKEPETRLVRTMEGKARAFLSDKFRPIDNYDLLANSIFPAIQPFRNELQVMSNSLSETRMYLQLVFPKIQGEIKKGDVVQFGIVLTNSEVGAGAVDVRGMDWRLSCLNGRIAESLFRKYHVGRRIGSEEGDDMNIFAYDTVKKELEAYQLRLRDVIKHVLSESVFENRLKMMRDAREGDNKIVNLPQTVENVTKRFALSEKDGQSIITNMAAEGEINRYGLSNAITALAHSIENPDRQYDVEKLGSQVIELSPRDWKVLTAEKAA